jgi:hypothetical protein
VKDPLKAGLGILAQNLAELEGILALVPVEHRGIRFERVLNNFNPQDSTCMLERGFAIEWAEANKWRNQLGSILDGEANDPRIDAAPRTPREWEVAQLVAASLIRWLPTSVGCSFLQEAFKRSGGSMSYVLPDPKRGMPPLRE